jgi:hypothetical protein
MGSRQPESPARQAESKHLQYISAFYEYNIFTFTLATLLAVIFTYPGSEVLSFKSSFLYIELKHVYLKEAEVGRRAKNCFPADQMARNEVQQGSIDLFRSLS